jgi:hypothetical protein
MREPLNSNLPPPELLAALRIPRAEQVRAMGAWQRAMRDPWRRDWLLAPFEIAALRREAKANSAYFRAAFADLRRVEATAQEVGAQRFRARQEANPGPAASRYPYKRKR